MASTEVDIYNMACASIGADSNIATTDERSVEAEQCTIWYETVRDQVLGAAYWPSVRATARLALLATRDNDDSWVVGDPEPGWNYAYGRPADMLRPRYLTSYARFAQGIRGTNTPAIMTDQAEALLIYTKRQTAVNVWDADLALAISFHLAAHIALKLTGSRGKRSDAFQLAQEKVMTARVNSANEFPPNLDFAPSAMIARGYGDSGPTPRFLYPPAQLTLVGSNNVS